MAYQLSCFVATPALNALGHPGIRFFQSGNHHVGTRFPMSPEQWALQNHKYGQIFDQLSFERIFGEIFGLINGSPGYRNIVKPNKE